jgi:fumarate reductase subunit C
MSLRELWDTVVLRDILGYIFPGAVTLLALAVLLTRPGVEEWSLLGTCSNRGLPGLFRLIEEHPLLLFAVGAASYAIGHLQIWIVEWLEKKLPIFDNGKLTLAFLCKNGMGEDYARAGLRLSDLSEASSFAQEPLIRCLQKCKEKRQKQLDSVLRFLCDSQRSDMKNDKIRKDAESQAEEIWRLCDRYVQHLDGDTHGMFMGWYYILWVLFSNLGMSALLLAASASTTFVEADDVPMVVIAFVVLLVLVVIAAVTSTPTAACQRVAHRILRTATRLGTVLLAAMCCAASLLRWPSPGAALMPLGIGALLLTRSSFFRRRFVDCTFPIFYAIFQAEKRSEAHEA